MKRVTTWNVNGLRRAAARGFRDVVADLSPDVLLLQEVRCEPDPTLAAELGYKSCWCPCARSGHAGVAIWSRRSMGNVERDLVDGEGRFLRVRTDGLEFVSVYVPCGAGPAAKRTLKLEWLAGLTSRMEDLATSSYPVVMGGDFNIARTQWDVHPGGQKSRPTGYRPEEVQWFSGFMSQGWTDLLRGSAGDVPGPYTWRSHNPDHGWRFDYLLANAAFPAARAYVTPEGWAVSDHAPVTLDLAR